MVIVPNSFHGKTISIPVKVVGGKIEFFYGGSLPSLKNGAVGDLLISEHAVKQEEVVRWLQAEYPIEFLPAGERVLLAVDINRVPEGLRQQVVCLENRLDRKYSTFVPVTLDEPLQLLLRGDKQAVLRYCQCHFFATERIEAKSLNHACTLISELFEPSRTSRGGNVFRLGHYEDTDGCLRPLDNLRRKYQSQLEQYLGLVSLWIRLVPPESDEHSFGYQKTILAGDTKLLRETDESDQALRSYLLGNRQKVIGIVERHRKALTEMLAGLDLDDNGRPSDRRLASALSLIVDLYRGTNCTRELDPLSAVIELLLATRTEWDQESSPMDRDRLLDTVKPILFDILEDCKPDFSPPGPSVHHEGLKSDR